MVVAAQIGVAGDDGLTTRRRRYCGGFFLSRFWFAAEEKREAREACERSRVVGEDKMGAGVVQKKSEERWCAGEGQSITHLACSLPGEKTTTPKEARIEGVHGLRKDGQLG